MSVARTAILLSLLITGCGSRSDDLKPGDHAMIRYVEAELQNATSKGVDGKVRVITNEHEIAKLDEGLRVIVLENKDFKELNQFNSLKVRIDEGEFAGRTCTVARLFLQKINPRG